MRRQKKRDVQASVIAVLAYGLLVHVYPPAVTATPPIQHHVVQGPVTAVAAVPSTILSAVQPAAGTRTIALTFDDGPDARWTPLVLDLLARHNAVATFCVVGQNASRHQDLVHRTVAAGMRLCNHTHSHDDQVTTRPAEALNHEVVATQSELAALAGAPVPYFRAPGGVWSQPLQTMAAEHGMRPLGWNVDSRDWQQPGVDQIVRAVQNQVHPGAVVLLHDGGGRRDQTVVALEQVLPWLVAHCYGFGFPTP